MKETSIYIHIPFCDHKCIYCDFYSIITYENKVSYLNSLLNEIEYFSEKYSNDRKIISIFFGGGTPSLMEADYIEKIISKIKSSFSFSSNAEITLEANPGTINKTKLNEFLDVGINRISLGVQSFDENDLKFLTRIHNSHIAVNSVEEAYSVGFKNISIDLIFNLPNQSFKKWKKNLIKAVELPISHISTYSLILEKGTILNKLVKDGKVKIPDINNDAKLYEFTIDYLMENNFTQYEVSNFAKKGFECIHNNSYWHYKDYLGFGTSAHSFINPKRWWNISSARFYIEKIKNDKNAIIGEELLTKEQMENEFIMLAFRSSGLDIVELEKRFGNKWLIKNESQLKQFIDKNFIQEEENKLKLTKKGYAICDEILLKFK